MPDIKDIQYPFNCIQNEKVNKYIVSGNYKGVYSKLYVF